MLSSTYVISGRIIDRESERGIGNLRVEAWDKDQHFDDLVGSAATDDQGNFEIRFDETYFSELFSDFYPDLYFRVFCAGKMIASTEESVLWNVRSPHVEVEIEVNEEDCEDEDDEQPCRDIYLKIERIEEYSPVQPQEKSVPPIEYGRDCMRNKGHEDGTIPEAEIAARSLTALVYREYLDPDYLVPKVDKLVHADINEPVFDRRVPGTVIYTRPGETLCIHVLNGDTESHSLHLHGLVYGIDSDGAWPFGTESADGRRSDEICPGQSWTYRFRVTEDAIGVWPFHDHGSHGIHESIDRGLFGGIVVLPPGIKPPPTMKIPPTYPALEELRRLFGRRRVLADALPLGKKLQMRRLREDLHEQLLGVLTLPPKRQPILHVPVFLHVMFNNESSPSFDSGDLEEHGGTFSRVFSEEGDFDYFCQYHPIMTGTVQVTAGGPATASVNIVDAPAMSFSPQVITVGVGGTVEWTNQSDEHHTVTSEQGAAQSSHCINGRAFVGNTPTVVAMAGQRIRWYVFNLDLGTDFHNFHPHAQRWSFAGENIDVRSLSPAESFVVETTAPPVLLLTGEMKKIQDPDHRPEDAKLYRLRGDYVWHCRVHHHLMGGMVGLVRSKQHVWLTPAMAEQLEKERGLPLDDGGNNCPDVTAGRCKKNADGEWEEVPGAPDVTMMHAALLPQSSKVLFFGYDTTPNIPSADDYSRLWDPASGTYGPPNNQPADVTAGDYTQWSLWSSEHIFLDSPEGLLLVHGGYRSDLKKSYLFNPDTELWSKVESTADDRFYATTINLADGRALTLFGSASTSIETYELGVGWSAPTALPLTFNYQYYPWTYLLPDGQLFIAGPESPTRRFDPNAPADVAAETWATNEGTRSLGGQNGSSALLTLRPPNYEPVVVIVGGNNAGLIDSAEWINLAEPTPAWTALPNMSEERGNLTAVLLPDGRLFVAGGIPGSGGPAEIFDPQNPGDGWLLGPEMTYSRVYHSSMILLADGSVLAGGDPRVGGVETPHERYYPSYFFEARPTIGAAPPTIGYGASFQIDSPEASTIQEVILMRPGAVTHGFNMSQRAVECEITGGDAVSLTVSSPPTGNIAPQGWYLLFIVDANRVPSEGRWIRLTS